jgi:hypothetical protein
MIKNKTTYTGDSYDRIEYVTISSICCFILYHVRASVSMIVWNM